MEKTLNNIILNSIGHLLTSSLDPDKRLLEDLGAKPIEILEIFFSISAVFGVQVTADDAKKVKTIADILAFIRHNAPEDRIAQCRETLSTMDYVRIFPGMAYKLGVLSQDMILFLEAMLGYQVRQNIDFTGIHISGLYLMQHLEEGCSANCAFCVQSNESSDALKKSMLVDNKLMIFPIPVLEKTIQKAVKNGIERICIQTVYNKNTVENLVSLTKSIRAMCDIPISGCCVPVSRESLKALKAAGMDTVFINYETATPELFDQIRGRGRKGPYRWEKTTEAIDNALEIFGDYKVGSHLQIGFGETQKDALTLIQNLEDKKCRVSLIAFRPLPGTAMENHPRSSHANFHAIQLGCYLIQNKIRRVDRFEFDMYGNIRDFALTPEGLHFLIRSGSPFRNRGGCPGCNRVYYETNPGERFYTYPREIQPDELCVIESELMHETTETMLAQMVSLC